MDAKRDRLILIIGSGLAVLLVICIILLALNLAQDKRKSARRRADSADAQESLLEEEEGSFAEQSATPAKADSRKKAGKSDKSGKNDKNDESDENRETGDNVNSKPQSKSKKESKAHTEGKSGHVGSNAEPDLSDYIFDAVSNGQKMVLVFVNAGESVEREGFYSGAVTSGQPDGYGSFTAENGDGIRFTYQGRWKNGRAEGEGIAVWEDADNESSGKGCLQYCDGDFEGGAFVYGTVQRHLQNGNRSHTGDFPPERPSVPTPPAGFPTVPTPPATVSAESFLGF